MSTTFKVGDRVRTKRGRAGVVVEYSDKYPQYRDKACVRYDDCGYEGDDYHSVPFVNLDLIDTRKRLREYTDLADGDVVVIAGVDLHIVPGLNGEPTIAFSGSRIYLTHEILSAMLVDEVRRKPRTKKQPPDAASTFDTKRMRACAPLLPEPGDDVVLQCLDEVDALRSQVTALAEERDQARAANDVVKYMLKTRTAEVEDALARADRAEKERDEARVSEKTALDDALKLLHERDRAIAERDEAREAWGRAESDACEWEEKAGVASADLATFTEKLHKAEQERDDLGCQLEALRAVQRGDVADLRTRMEAVEKAHRNLAVAAALSAKDVTSPLQAIAKKIRDDEKARGVSVSGFDVVVNGVPVTCVDDDKGGV